MDAVHATWRLCLHDMVQSKLSFCVLVTLSDEEQDCGNAEVYKDGAPILS